MKDCPESRKFVVIMRAKTVLAMNLFRCFVGMLFLTAGSAQAEQADGVPDRASLPVHPDSSLSLKLEIQHAIDRGVQWLGGQQNRDTGSWSDAAQPALTALPLAAMMGDPSRKPHDAPLTSRRHGLLISSREGAGRRRHLRKRSRLLQHFIVTDGTPPLPLGGV